MPVVAAYLYRDGAHVRSVAIDQCCEEARDKSEFVWIGLAEPAAEEMHALQDCYGLHPLAVEDAINGPAAQGGGLRRLAFRGRANRPPGGRQAGICRDGDHHIITVRHGSPRSHTALREQLEKGAEAAHACTDYLLHAVLDFIVDGYAPAVDHLEDEVLEMEQKTVDSFLGREDVNRIFTLRRELIGFHRRSSQSAPGLYRRFRHTGWI